MQTFGELLRKYRQEAGLSQAQLARKISTNTYYISKAENNQLESISTETLAKITRRLAGTFLLSMEEREKFIALSTVEKTVRTAYKKITPKEKILKTNNRRPMEILGELLKVLREEKGVRNKGVLELEEFILLKEEGGNPRLQIILS